MTQKINLIQDENSWQKKFIFSFIKMCDQLSLNYGNKLKLNSLGNDLKKKTKVCWQYMKDLISFFINDSSTLQKTHDKYN